MASVLPGRRARTPGPGPARCAAARGCWSPRGCWWPSRCWRGVGVHPVEPPGAGAHGQPVVQQRCRRRPGPTSPRPVTRPPGWPPGSTSSCCLIPAAGLAYPAGPDRGPRGDPGQPAAGRPRPGTARRPGALGALAGVAGVTLAGGGEPRPGPAPASAAANQAQAAAWVAQQVSPGTVVSCDPATCGQLQRDGFPAARLMTLGPATRDPLGSGVVIGTPGRPRRVRHPPGHGLRAAGAGGLRLGREPGRGTGHRPRRRRGPGGRSSAAQRASLRSAGQQLLRNRTIQASPAARAALLAGRVDARLLANLSVLSSQQSITAGGLRRRAARRQSHRPPARGPAQRHLGRGPVGHPGLPARAAGHVPAGRGRRDQ